MRKHTSKFFAALLILFAAASCSTDEAVLTSTQDVTERVDIELEGAISEYINLQSLEEDASMDLVQYNFYGNPSSRFDIKVNLGDNRTLVFKLVNEMAVNPWEKEESYSVFATQDLEDKQKYVTVELMHGGEYPEYMSNANGAEFPQGTLIDVFRIEDFNPASSEIMCRIVDLPLESPTEQNEQITLSGTFRGAVTFLD